MPRLSVTEPPGKGGNIIDDSWSLDMTALRARDLAVLGDSVLAHAMRRILAENDDQQDPQTADTVAAHDSHI
jgi:hypothetical protein